MRESHKLKVETPTWTSVGYMPKPGDSKNLILIECDGATHRRAIYHPESGGYVPSGDSYPCDQGEHSVLFEQEKHL